MRRILTLIALTLIASGLFMLSIPAQDARFLGARRCGECHDQEYKIWEKGRHAKAYEMLPAGKREDLTCLWCHATDVRENFRAFKHAGVQCEACHGSGYQEAVGNMGTTFVSEHKKRIKKPTEETCRNCHSNDRTPSIEPFNYSEQLQLIKHWK